ncbi:hypothetical protein HK105_202959 [Polyrhizophydium stewartii]|uniref:NADH-ubiquinone oxidoreductase 14 kDa subunit n=1 Tax=Polyrhizophydium stewartii TaxID=2732419 RepID=A0ABR4NCR0_9FUNG
MILLPTKAIDIEPTATETALHVATWGAAGFAVHTWANGIRMRPLMSAPHLHVLFTLGGAAFGVFMHRFEQSRLQMLKAQRDILVKRRMERALE